jgi:aspartyl-tRNA(Asn)/glutamyl-tRNA(Gln) amidotransferase subunit B
MTGPSKPTLLDYDEAIERFDPVLGLEVHVELGTATKMFCGCPTEFGAPPNTQVCPVCLALPGAMPAINRTAVEYAIRIGLALHCTIAPWCQFARKNYFYPDMPKNFQTSQYDDPIASNGYLDVDVDGETVRVEIERAGRTMTKEETITLKAGESQELNFEFDGDKLASAR